MLICHSISVEIVLIWNWSRIYWKNQISDLDQMG